MAAMEKPEQSKGGWKDDDNGNGGGGECEPRLTYMLIRYCDDNCVEYEREIDVNKAGGLVWDCDAGGTTIPKYEHCHKVGDPEIPGSKPQPTGEKCGTIPPQGTSCCWWDGTKWVCPPDFD